MTYQTSCYSPCCSFWEKIKYENVKAVFFFKKQIHCSQSSITTCLKPCLLKASKPWKSGIKNNARRRWSFFFSRNKALQIKSHKELSDGDGKSLRSSKRLSKKPRPSSHISQEERDDSSHAEESRG